MNKVQFIEENGEKVYAILPVADFDRLIQATEDLDDMEGIVEIRTALKTGQETFPLEFIEALIDTDSRLREWRKFRGMSQAKLGVAAGLSQAAITQIETGKRKPNIDTARKLADALQCDIDDLF